MTGRLEFDRLRTEGTRVVCGSVWVRYLADPDRSAAQIGFAVGRNVGSAVVRNTIRRRLRHLLRVLDQEITGGLPSGTYLIGLRHHTRRVSYADLQDSLRHCLTTLNQGAR